MNVHEALETLRKLGSERNRRIYRRHGAGENVYGVSFADLGRLTKKIKVDHELARALWATGNADARCLATMVADPAATTDEMLDTWAGDLDHYGLTDVFVTNLVSRTPFGRRKAESWIRSREEWIGRAGWMLVAYLALRDATLPDPYFEGHVATIEARIHEAKNRVKDAMNGALIAIGLRSLALEKKALAAARRIGRVEVDHGETGCKTPDAVEYIARARRRRRGAAERGRGSAAEGRPR